MVRILLANRFPHILWWGPHYIQFYNDPYRPIPGARYPDKALRPASECWAEIWHVIGPLIDRPFNGGPATWDGDISLEINRHGFIEEAHFTIAHSPAPDETAPRGVGWMLATLHEITGKVIGTRVGEAKTAEEACRIAAAPLATHDKDVPFALLYLLDADGTHARLAGATGVEMGEAISPLVVDLEAGDGWPLAEAKRCEAMQVVEPLGERFARVPSGPWSDAPHTAVVLPIPSNMPHPPAGLLVAGVSARLELDEFYHGVLPRGTQARTHEGTGIGLALVQELVKLHGGTVTATSAVGLGSTFTVTVPTGSAHLPSERRGATRTLTSAALGGEAYVEEALRRLPEVDDPSLSRGAVDALNTDGAWSRVHVATPRHPQEPPSARILLADDNADMRAYVGRLLRVRWEVEAVPDGAAALVAAGARVPDLVLTDVMTPGLDGFELLRELRADARTREVPVILLSARAGEESREEGLDAGADDYLIKPFGARELIARVGARLELATLARVGA